MVLFCLSAISFFLSLLILQIIINQKWLLSIDTPNYRSSHEKPTPSGGGFSFVIISVLVSFYLKDFTYLMCSPLALIGFMDDKLNLRASIRYIAQFLTCIFLSIHSTIYTNINSNSFFSSIIILALISFIGSGLINFTNFQDNVLLFL